MNFAEQMINAFGEQFAEETKLRKEVAQKIIKMLAKKAQENDIIKIEDFQDVLWRLKRNIEKSIDFTKLLNKIKDDQIATVIEEMITQKEMWKKRNGEQDFSHKAESVWFFESLEFKDKVMKAGDKVKIQIMREGKWNHPAYGEVLVTKQVISDVIKNFESRERGIDLAVDENHEPNHKALGWFKELFQEGKKTLFATIELTKKGAELINEGAYKYFSPEIVFRKTDEESGKQISNLLIGGAFTNRPFFKAMKPLLASEEGVASNNNELEFEENHNAFLIFNNPKMNKFLQLLAKFSQLEKFSEGETEKLKVAFSELSEEDKTPELEKTFNDAIEKAEEGGSDEGEGEGAPEDKNEGAGEGEGEGAGEGEGSEGAGEEGAGEGEGEGNDAGDTPTVKANEDGTRTVQMSESAYELLKKNAASAQKLVKEAKFREVQDKVDGLVFSENNKMGAVLPKSKDKISAFAAGLSDSQMAEFFSIMEKLQTVAASEMGSDGEPAEKFNDEEVKFLMDKMSFSEDQAKDTLRKKAK